MKRLFQEGSKIKKKFNEMSIFCLMFILLLTLVGCKKSNETKNSIVEKNLSKIISTSNINVQLASNPYEYISNNKKEYADIVSSEGALEYMLNEFNKSNEDGLKEYIMAVACCDILGEDGNNVQWNSGREWYKNYLSNRES
ncbi:hypothetical protein KQI30_02880 [Clostridium bornimense]|uniref:hypothetical protein n=2 Tax=Clostridium TaxID=1485 RepID=UPI001C100385|nr:hypothetical protein [Clostridium bornimense]MBU5315221.1 hypothetical protein [Clostridium bornimense]